MKIFVSRKIINLNIQSLKDHGIQVDIWQGESPPSWQELLERSQDAHGLICMLSDQINKDFIKRCPQLKVIANYAVGFNNIDLITAKKQNIQVGNTPDVLTQATSDLALTLTLCASRQIKGSTKNAAAGKWQGFSPLGFLGPELRNKTVGIIGAGRIGSAYAQLMKKAFNTKTLYYSRSKNSTLENLVNAKKTKLHELLKESDIISIHLPLTDKTFHLLKYKELSLMKKSSILVNTARGEIIKQDDLVKVLENQQIFAAALDVTTPEPLDMNHKLFELENCIITPHIGSATFEARTQMTQICVSNIITGLRDEKIPFAIPVGQKD